MHSKLTKAQMKADFCEGKFPSMAALCRHYDVPEDTANKWRREEHWQESRAVVLEMKQEKTLEAIADKMSKENQRAYDLSSGIMGLTGQKMVMIDEDLKDHAGEKASKRKDRIKATDLVMMSTAVEKCHKTQRLAVGKDDEDGGRIKIDVPDIRAQLQAQVESGLLPGAVGKPKPTNGNGTKQE